MNFIIIIIEFGELLLWTSPRIIKDGAYWVYMYMLQVKFIFRGQIYFNLGYFF